MWIIKKHGEFIAVFFYCVGFWVMMLGGTNMRKYGHMKSGQY